MEELADLARQRRRAGDEVAHAAAERLLDPIEHEPVGDLELEREQAARLLALLAQLRAFFADRDRPLEDLNLERAAFLRLLDDAVVDLLEDPRHGGHQRRPYDREIVDELRDPAVDRGHRARRDVPGEQDLAERVRHRQPEILDVARRSTDRSRRSRRRNTPSTRGASARPSACPSCPTCRSASRGAPLRSRRRARRRPARPSRGLQRPSPRDRRATSSSSPSPAPSIRMTFSIVGISALCARSFSSCLASSANTYLRVGVGEDERALLGGARRIDRRRRAARRQDAEVGEQPVEPRVRQDADALLAVQAERDAARPRSP